MAQAILGALRAGREDVQVAFTFFSPSAERVAARIGADVWGYLPWDVHADSTALLDALRPAAIAFVRTEIWPVLGALAAERGIPTLLLNAVLAEGSSRLSPPARFLLGPAFRRLHAIGAVSAEDGARFARLGVDPSRIHVTGDARFDQVAARIERIDRHSPMIERLRTPRSTLVAGSTWPTDEDVLIPAIAALAPELRPRVILAPHQPTPGHLDGAEQRARAAGLTVRRLADVERDGGAADVVLVDRVGVLADLYVLADVAYVGGGFGNAGLHSVVEPAALGVPALYGPRHGNAREAAALAAAGGGRVVGRESLREALEALLGSTGVRREGGEAAARFVRGHLGGGAANAALILAALDQRVHVPDRIEE
jgi:3-deoxy-D-manno-octulosonic-acid transferase